jgi:hypothetical protein
MDFVVFPEYTLVRSNVVTGSMAASHQQKLVALHAVARDDDGTVHNRTECGLPCRFGPDEGEPRAWDQVHPYLKCQVCVDTAGGALITPTGERVMPPPRI